MHWLLRFLLSETDRRAIESDLAELYELRRRQDGPEVAARWLRRQRLLYPLHVLADRALGWITGSPAAVRRLGRDAVHSARGLAHAPGLSLTIVLTVGLGLGAATAMLAIVRAVLFNPLPYAAPGELVWIYTDNPPYRFRLSVVDYRAIEAEHPGFSSVAAYQTSSVTLTDAAGPERATLKAVTGSYFPLLGQRPLLGRLFDPSDDGRGAHEVVLTAGHWTRRFGRDPAILGRTVNVDGTAHAVVGVLEEVNGPLERDVAMFSVARWPAPRRKGPFFTMVLGRLRSDVSPAVTLDALRATNRRLFPIWKSSYQDEKATWGMLDLKARVVGDVGSTLTVVLAAVGCVLLISCLNAVNLLVARAIARGRELAIRTALGASRFQLLQYLAIESALLTAAAMAVALAVAQVAIGFVATYGVAYIPRIGEVHLSVPVLGWLALLSAASGVILLLGSVPALRGSRAQLDRTLRTGGRSSTDSRGSHRLRRALVALQFTLATPLIVAAVLVAASLGRLSRVDVGIDTERVLTAAISLSGPAYATERDRRAFWERALGRFGTLPGVEHAALADGRPPAQSGNRNNFDLEDHPTPPGQNQPICTWVAASPGFFKTVGLPLQRGRLLDDFSLRDYAIVVDRAWADRFFPGQEVVGRRLRSGGCTDCPWTTVVGVVGNVKWTGLEASADGTVYWPFVDFRSGFVVLRTSGDPLPVATSLRQALRELDPALPLTSITTADALVSESLAAPRYLSVLVAVFAAAAVLLAVVGIYGVMAYFVEQHSRDIGIRLALGGDPSAVRRMIVGQGLRWVAAGVAAGLGAAIAAARSLSTLLFEVSATDLPTLTVVPLALLLIAALGCIVPGYRASRLDPAQVLRE